MFKTMSCLYLPARRRYGGRHSHNVCDGWSEVFKPNTDDMRDAPPIPLITALQDIGAVVNVFGDHGHSRHCGSSQYLLAGRSLAKWHSVLRGRATAAGSRRISMIAEQLAALDAAQHRAPCSILEANSAANAHQAC
jgi:UDP-glucose 6-dehydrogenase